MTSAFALAPPILRHLPRRAVKVSHPRCSEALYRPCPRPFSSSPTMLTKQIVTHSGTFHCDEVLAVHMLRHTAAFANASVLRTRAPDAFPPADAVVDVGSIYDAPSNRFDHHMREFCETFEAAPGARSRTKLSSAGLVYKHHGEEVVRRVLEGAGVSVGDGDLRRVYLKVYDTFVEALDAIDNGIAQFDTKEPPRWSSGTDLGARVGGMNSAWNEETSDEIQDANFAKAVAMAGAEFDGAILDVAKSWLPARSIIARAMGARFENDSDGRILVLTDWAPWKDHLFTIEEEEAKVGSVRYVVYKETPPASNWRVQAVPMHKSSFASRTPLPASWRGLRGEELSKLAGIEKCVFTHASGFIGGNETFEGTMEMVRLSLKMAVA